MRTFASVAEGRARRSARAIESSRLPLSPETTQESVRKLRTSTPAPANPGAVLLCLSQRQLFGRSQKLTTTPGIAKAQTIYSVRVQVRCPTAAGFSDLPQLWKVWNLVCGRISA